jgi:hypothetical protein
MNLSEHFTLGELTSSDHAKRHGIDNTPTPEIIENLKRLCVDVLEPMRALLGSAVYPTSGYRSPLVNLGIGGSSTSQHMRGEAADFHVHGYTDEDVARAVMTSAVPFDQLILEFPPDGWVHISCSHHPRHQVLIATRGRDGRTSYSPWQG